jgi:hypothetical protein
VHDSYLFLTPVLTLLVVALVGFVGCDALFGLQHIDDPLKAVQNVSATANDKSVTIKWDAYAGATMISVKYGTTSGSYPESRDLTMGETETLIDMLTNGVTYYFVVVAMVGSRTAPASSEVSATPTIPSGLAPFVTGFAPGTPKNSYTGWLGFALQIGTSPLVVKTLGRAYAPGNSATHEIKIVDAATHVDVGGASVSLTITADSVGNFQFESLANPVTLSPNATYYVVSRETSGADQYFDHDTAIQHSPVAQVTASVYGDDLGGFFEVPPPDYSYGPVNFQF